MTFAKHRCWPLIWVALLTGCSTYEALPLDTMPQLAARLPEPYRQKPSLALADITALTVELNPDLKTVRDDRTIAAATVVQAGILPNPQFTGSYDFLLGGPAMFNAFAMALGEDIKAIVLRGALRESAAADQHRVDADLLWQEWQTISKAQLLYVDLIAMQKARENLQATQILFADRYRHSHAALMQGDVDLTVAAPDLAALTAADKQLNDLDTRLQSKWQELDALLGLQPDVRLVLNKDLAVTPFDAKAIEKSISSIQKARPDLVALRYGYQSQEAKLRGSILGQFPALIFGGNYGTDTSHVYSGGPAVTVDLPIFNRNQGNIQLETATRQKLRDEFASHLLATEGEVKSLLAARVLVMRQWQQLQATAADSAQTAANAQSAYGAGNIDERSYVDLMTASLVHKQEMLALEQALLEQQVALASLIGAGMPQLSPLDTGIGP